RPRLCYTAPAWPHPSFISTSSIRIIQKARYQRTQSRMTDWSNWRPLNIQSSERSEALLATKTVFKTLQHNPPREAYGMSKAQIVGWAHAPFGKSEAPDTEALMASVVAPALTHAGVAPNEVDG